MNHGDFGRRFTGNRSDLRTGHPFFDIFYYGLRKTDPWCDRKPYTLPA
jgi:hypothetical protein